MGTLLFALFMIIEVSFLIIAINKQDYLQKQRIIARVVIEIGIILLMLMNILQGFFRYGGLIVILILQILTQGINYQRGKRKSYSLGKSIRALLINILVFGFALFPAILLPQYTEPQMTGSHEIEEFDFTWIDESRIETYDESGEYRKVTVHIWSPKEDGSYPLVLFDHGGTGIIASNTSTCKELASNGYIVVSVGHPYQSLYLKDTDGKVTMFDKDFLNKVMGGAAGSDSYSEESERKVYENAVEWMNIRGNDDNFVLNTMLNFASKEIAPFNKINPEKIGVFGHSMGGASAVLLGRMRSDISAVIDLEGTMLGEYIGFENGYSTYNQEKYEVPVLDVYSRDIYEQAIALEDVQYVNFYLGNQADDYRIDVIEGAGHLNFTDLPLVCPLAAKLLGVGEVNAKECIEEVNKLVLDYFNEYLK